MKNVFIIIMSIMSFNGFAQIQNPMVEKTDAPQCEIMHIGLTDSLTYVFFKYTNNREIGSWISVSDKFYIIDPETNKKFKLVNSYNIPISPSVHVFSSENQVHYFSLAFEPIPKTTKKIDIIENPKEGFNFYGVSLESKNNYIEVDYPALLEETPVKEKGSFYKDGKVIQYYVHNGFVIAVHLSIDKDYGKYYMANITIESYNNKRVDFLPENISATLQKKDKKIPLEVLTYEDYIHKVKRMQGWNSLFVAVGEASAANQAGYSASRTRSSYGSSTTISYDASANYYAQQNARRNFSNLKSQQYSIKESINLGYMKSNTIFSNQRINGYVNIKYKFGDYIIVTIPLNGENYTFYAKNNEDNNIFH